MRLPSGDGVWRRCAGCPLRAQGNPLSPLGEAAKDPLFESSIGLARATNYADWTFSLFAPLLSGNVLEVGCGVGTFTRLLVGVSACRRVMSIDVSAEAVAYCRTQVIHTSLEVAVADVLTIQERFDVIICMNVLEHIEDDAGALRHMLNLLRPGGTLFLLVPAHSVLYSSFDREAGHYRRYNKHQMNALVGRVADARSLALRQFYFNSIGAIGYFIVYRLLRKPPRADASAEIGWFDRYIVPLLRRIEKNGSPFGTSLVTIIRRDGVS